MEDIIGAVLVTSFIGHGISLVPVMRAALFFGSYYIPNATYQFAAIYASTLLTGLIHHQFFDVLAICLLIYGSYFKRQATKQTLAALIVPYLVLTSIVHTNQEPEALLVITSGVLTYIMQHHHASTKRQGWMNQAQLKELQAIKDDIEQVQKEHSFHEFIMHPIVSRRTQQLIKKLRIIKKIVPNVSHAAHKLNQSEDFLELSKDVEKRMNASHDVERSPNREEPERDLDSSEILQSKDLKDSLEQKFIKSEIDEIIYALISREYIMWNEPGDRDRSVRRAKVEDEPEEQKAKFSQPVLALNAKRMTDFSIPKLHSSSMSMSKSQIMRSTLEDHIDITIDLNAIGEWNFDTLDFSEKTNKEPILEMGRHIFDSLNLSETFEIKESVLADFLRGVESMYSRNNYYHSNIHGADVTNSALFLLQQGLLTRGAVADLEILALIVSAICHDVAHPGVNNAFLVATQDKLALKYNDASVLENMHASTTFRVLQRPNSNIVANLVHDDWVNFRKVVVALILATDLQKHFDIVTDFKQINESEQGLQMNEDSHRMMALELAIKCADIAHGAKRLEIHKRWTGLVTKEFFAQGDRERNLGVPISPLCDRHSVVLANSQKGFLSFLVLPIYELWESFVNFGHSMEDEDVEPYLLPVKMIQENLAFWESESENQTFYLDASPPPALMKRGPSLRKVTTAYQEKKSEV